MNMCDWRKNTQSITNEKKTVRNEKIMRRILHSSSKLNKANELQENSHFDPS